MNIPDLLKSIVFKFKHNVGTWRRHVKIGNGLSLTGKGFGNISFYYIDHVTTWKGHAINWKLLLQRNLLL